MREQHLPVDRHQPALRERFANPHARVAAYTCMVRP
jgi:hypothetical protein